MGRLILGHRGRRIELWRSGYRGRGERFHLGEEALEHGGGRERILCFWGGLGRGSSVKGGLLWDSYAVVGHREGPKFGLHHRGHLDSVVQVTGLAASYVDSDVPT